MPAPGHVSHRDPAQRLESHGTPSAACRSRGSTTCCCYANLSRAETRIWFAQWPVRPTREPAGNGGFSPPPRLTPTVLERVVVDSCRAPRYPTRCRWLVRAVPFWASGARSAVVPRRFLPSEPGCEVGGGGWPGPSRPADSYTRAVAEAPRPGAGRAERPLRAVRRPSG